MGVAVQVGMAWNPIQVKNAQEAISLGAGNNKSDAPDEAGISSGDKPPDEAADGVLRVREDVEVEGAASCR